MKPTINGKEAEWDGRILALWIEHVAPLFKEGETCSQAGFFDPRPYVDEYNRGSPYQGFCYTVQPGNRVCFKQWIPS